MRMRVHLYSKYGFPCMQGASPTSQNRVMETKKQAKYVQNAIFLFTLHCFDKQKT